MRIFPLVVLSLTVALSACATRPLSPPDQRPLRVRIADRFILGKDLSKVADVGIFEVKLETPSFCVIAKTTDFIGLTRDVIRYYYEVPSREGRTNIAEIDSGTEAVFSLIIIARCPFSREKYSPFPEYEALKKQRGL